MEVFDEIADHMIGGLNMIYFLPIDRAICIILLLCQAEFPIIFNLIQMIDFQVSVCNQFPPRLLNS